MSRKPPHMGGKGEGAKAFEHEGARVARATAPAVLETPEAVFHHLGEDVDLLQKLMDCKEEFEKTPILSTADVYEAYLKHKTEGREGAVIFVDRREYVEDLGAKSYILYGIPFNVCAIEHFEKMKEHVPAGLKILREQVKDPKELYRFLASDIVHLPGVIAYSQKSNKYLSLVLMTDTSGTEKMFKLCWLDIENKTIAGEKMLYYKQP